MTGVSFRARTTPRRGHDAAAMLLWGCLVGEELVVDVWKREAAAGVGDGDMWRWVAGFTGLGTRLGAFGLLR